jgi:hypothetical protein
MLLTHNQYVVMLDESNVSFANQEENELPHDDILDHLT